MAFPAVESRTANNATGGAASSGSTAATSHSVVLPGTVSAGSLLMVFGRTTGTGAISFPAGWSVGQSASDASDDMAFWAYRQTLANGTEAGTSITVSHVNSNKMVAASYSITGAANPAVLTPQVSNVAFGTGSTVSPTACTPTGGAKDYLWLAVGSADGEHASPPAGIPVNYGNSAGWSTGTAAAATTNGTLFIATRNWNTASEDAGNWSTSVAVASGWTAWLVAIHPSAVLTPASLTRTRAQGTPQAALAPVAIPTSLTHTRAQGTFTIILSHRTRMIGQPTVGPATSPTPASLVRTRAQGTPLVKPGVLPASLARSRAQGSPSIVINLQPAALTHNRSTTTPIVNPTINLQSAGIVRARGQGFVSVFLDFTLTPTGLVRTRAQGDFFTNPIATPASLVRTRALGTPAFHFIHRYRLLGSLQVLYGIVPASLSRDTLVWGEGEWGSYQWGEGRALGSPRLNPQVRPAAQARTRAQGALVATLVTGGASPASLTRTRALGAPHLNPVLSPAAQAHTRALGTIDVQVGHRFRALGSPVVNVVSATLSALVHTRAQGSPQIFAATPSPTSLVRSRAQGAAAAFAGHRFRALGAPIVAGSVLSPASLVRTRANGTILVTTSLGSTIDVDSVVHTRAQGATSVFAGHRVRALGLTEVSTGVEVTVSLSGLTSTGSVPFLLGMPNRQRLVGDPSAAVSNPGQVDPASLVRARALGSPQAQADVTVTPGSITHSRQVGITTIAGVGHRSRAIGTPTVAATTVQIRPSGLTSDYSTIPLLLGGPNRQRILGTPTAAQISAGAPGALVHTRELGLVSLSSGPVSLTHTRALGDPRTNVTISPAGLAHTRFASGATLLGPGVTVGNYNRMWMGVGL